MSKTAQYVQAGRLACTVEVSAQLSYVSHGLSHVCLSADYGRLAHVQGPKRGEVASDLASRLHSFHHLKA